MKISDRVTAGILYLMLAGFALAVLVIMLLPPPPLSWALLVSEPNALFLVVTISCLTLVSIAVAWIFFCVVAHISIYVVGH